MSGVCGTVAGVSTGDPFISDLPHAATIAPLSGDIKRTIGRLAEFGVRAVQFSAAQPGMRPRELDHSARRGINAALQRLELWCSGVDLWIPAEHFIDPQHVDRAMSAMLDAIRLAEDLGRCPVSCTLPLTISDDTPDGAAGAAEAFETIVETADHHGVPLADHRCPVVERDGVSIGIDPPAWQSAGEDPAVAAARYGERLVSARLADLLTTGLRGPVGDAASGRLDVQAYRAALMAAGYRRAVVVDARQWADPWVGLRQSIAAWRQAGQISM